MQATMFSLIFCFVILGGRQATGFLPLRDYKYFVSSITPLAQKHQPPGASPQLIHQTGS
jgi:hypothetical protein